MAKTKIADIIIGAFQFLYCIAFLGSFVAGVVMLCIIIVMGRDAAMANESLRIACGRCWAIFGGLFAFGLLWSVAKR